MSAIILWRNLVVFPSRNITLHFVKEFFFKKNSGYFYAKNFFLKKINKERKVIKRNKL